MAVIDEFYQSRGPSTNLFAYLESFLGEREGMNRALLAQRLKDSGANDAELLEMETRLRVQQATLSKAKGEAMAGNKKAAMDALGDLLDFKGKEYAAWVTAKGNVEAASAHERGATTRGARERQAEALKASQYSGTAVRRYRDLISDDKYGKMPEVRDYIGELNTEGSPLASFKIAIDGIMDEEKIDTAEARAKFIRDLTTDMGRPDLTSALGKIYLHDDDPEAVYTELTGGQSESQLREDLRRVSAGGITRDPLEVEAGNYISGKIQAGEIGGRSESTETRTKTGGGEAPGTEGGPQVTGVKVKGRPSLVTMLMQKVQDAEAGDANLAAMFDKGAADIDKQIASIEAARAKAKAPIFTGANYLLDNPNTVMDTRHLDDLERIGKRPREVQEELTTRMSQEPPGKAYRGMVRDEFDPDLPQTVLDPLAMSRGGEANVYAYAADIVKDGDENEMAKLLDQIPGSMLDAIAPLVKAKDADGLARLAEKYPDDTFAEAYDYELSRALKDPGHMPKLVGGLSSLEKPETRPGWADEALRTFDDKQLTLDKATAGLGRIRASVSEGRKVRAQPEAKADVEPPPSPAKQREVSATAKRAMASMDAEEKAKADAATGEDVATKTYVAWKEQGLSGPAMDAKIEEVQETTPLGRAMKAKLKSLRGQPAPDTSPWGSTEEDTEPYWKQGLPKDDASMSGM